MPLTNQSVLSYTLLHKLGEGGMAEVWLAENRIKKKAAVKILKEEFEKMQAVIDRFENEATVMVQLVHPNIRQVYDYATIDNRPCIIMEYLEGADLSTRLKNGERFNSTQLKEWWNQIAAALNYTHKKEVVHRDIKPSNIFLCDDGQVKLLDFGIAKIRSSITMTQTGSRMGTLMYMSPEQVKDSKNLDYRTDLYSLAVTFAHLLTGQSPYDNTNSSEFDIQMKIVSEPLSTDKLPTEWQNFLLPYLNKEPVQRPVLTLFENKTLVQPQTTQLLPSEEKAEETKVDTGTPSIKSPDELNGKTHYDKHSEQNEATIVETKDKPRTIEKKYASAKVQVPPKKKKSYAALWWVMGITAALIITAFIWQPWNSLPQVNTNSVLDVTVNSAYFSGTVHSEMFFPVSERGFCFGTGNYPTIEDNKVVCGSGVGHFSATLNNLAENTGYCVRAYAINIIGTAYGEVTVFQTENPKEGTFTDSRDGQTYKWVRIGDQVWMAENLNEEKFLNGELINHHIEELESYNPTWYYYNDDTLNGKKYGKLYNGYAVIDPRGICPEGWHIPTINDFDKLLNYVGNNTSEYYNALKDGGSCGFNALASGIFSRGYSLMGSFGPIWSSTHESRFALENFAIRYDFEDASTDFGFLKTCGLSVRCLKN